MDEETRLFEEGDLYTLVDENGKENVFEFIAMADYEGSSYLAFRPEDSEEEYVLLKLSQEEGESVLVTIDDDDEYDSVADYFDSEVFNTIDYDDEAETDDDNEDEEYGYIEEENDSEEDYE